MRPQVLFPLFAPVTSITGVGPRLAKLIERVAGPQVVDLLWHLPSGIIDRRYAPKIGEATQGVIATLTVRVETHIPPAHKRLPYKVRCSDETGFLHLVFFHAHADYLKKTLPEGETRVVSGKVELFQDELQITHPDDIGTLDELARLQAVEPVYPLTAGLTRKTLGKAVRAALDRAPELPEWIEPKLVVDKGWRGWRAALGEAHAPEEEQALAAEHKARTRLAYDELLASQLALLLVRARQRRLKGRRVAGNGGLREKCLAALPYSLTESQGRALDEILADMAGETRMIRLLQGDVGSGKTVVAFLAMLAAVEAGAQAALMAPTEILARQHFQTIAPLAEAAGIEVALLAGRERGKARQESVAALASGAAKIAVGTHALFQDEVVFADLAVAVIDEQHRFGVHQRMILTEKGEAVDVLAMTATPIPRTLLMAAYGDIDASRLTEKPAGRRPVDTRVLPLARIDEVVEACRRAVAAGDRIYWVCPLVEESEQSDLAAATERHGTLSRLFGETMVGLVHGAMKTTEKDKMMADFASGEVSLLVATTVIEVGVDVPEATIMVIEHAERFGLAQLHQLRGRVGRSDRPSTCLLLYAPPLTETARARLNILRQTDDGFRIAEEDLRLRGGGEVLGLRQSGLPDFRLVDWTAHADLLAVARDDARLALERDPELQSPRGEALRTLLYLFARDAAIKTMRSG